jgi:hypothetical protein
LYVPSRSKEDVFFFGGPALLASEQLGLHLFYFSCRTIHPFKTNTISLFVDFIGQP